MTKEEKRRLAIAILKKRKANAKQDYLSYVKYTNDNFIELPHSVYLANTINDMIDKRDKMLAGEIPKENQYLMVSMPPRHGKSMTITETLPSYFLSRETGAKAVLTAYSINLADDFARANTSKLKEDNVFGIKVQADNQNRLILDNNSVMVKAGIMGGITGKGAHLMIIDDPIKTAEEANSQTTRDKMWKEWVSSLSTRLEPPAIVILVMTRWHENDLVGRLLDPEYGTPLPWNVINLPLEAEENDILGRKPGEPLWPERYGYDFIKTRKEYPRDFNALYQGRPVAAEGNLIKREWFEDPKAWYIARPEFINTLPIVCMSVDATFKDTSKSDYVAIQVWGKKLNDYYLIDAITERMDFLATLQAIRNFKSMYPQIGMTFIEDKANGSAIISVLHKEMSGIISVNPKGGKESRVQAVLPYLAGGNVKLPQHKAFTKMILEQWFAFPNGTHDDGVDAMSQAINQMNYYYGDITRHKVSYDEFFGKDPNDNDNTLCGDFY